MVKQPEYLVGEVSYLIVIVTIERRVTRAEAAFLQIELHDRLSQCHIFWDFDHGRHVIHFARFVWIHTHIRRRKDTQQFSVWHTSRERNCSLEVLLFDQLSQSSQPRSPAHTGKLHIFTTPVLYLRRNIDQDIETLLNAHGSHIAHKKSLAAFKRRFRRNELELLKIRSV